MKKTEKIRYILDTLTNYYPEALCSLEYMEPWQLLFAVRMAAQCTDARVNLVTPVLYGRYPTLEEMAAANVEKVSEIIHSTGFFRAKARDIVATANLLLQNHGGVIPNSMEALLALPGVGRKTANLILGDVYNQPGVVIVDTHCLRITARLGLTDGTKEPAKAEVQLRKILPPDESSDFCHRIVLFGRDICTARGPKCGDCNLLPVCKHPQ